MDSNRTDSHLILLFISAIYLSDLSRQRGHSELFPLCSDVRRMSQLLSRNS
jgi:hypothetical protein